MVKEKYGKPVAYYIEELTEIRPGLSARVFHVQHPTLGFKKHVTTSQVVDVFPEGFETLNTFYLKMKQAY